MKKILFSIYALTLLTAVHAQKTDRSIRPKAGPAPEVKLADAQSFTLDNGMKVFVVENHKLPKVTYSIQLDVYPAQLADKAGMQSMVGELITSGTKTRAKEKFDEEVDFIGASINAANTGISGSSLTKYQDKMLELMSDALLNANFQQKDLDRLKKQALAGLEADKNDPETMLSNVSNVLNFGANHPYGTVKTEATVNNITLADCNNYYKTYFRPNVAYMAIVGDITLAKAKEMANKYFGKWQRADVPKAKYPGTSAPSATEVDFVSRDGAVQSVVNITYPVDLMIGSPDVIKTKVLNQVLGGSFQRLDRNLREKHAWTYGSHSYINPDRIAGEVGLNVKCRNGVTDSAVAEMLHEMNAIRNTPLTQAELQGAINYLSGVFALGLENPGTIAQYAINIDRYNMPKDYYKNYLKTLSAVTVADVQATAQQYMKPNNAHIVVVGSQSEAETLKKITNGNIKYFDNYGNPVKPAEVKEAKGVTVEQVLNKYIDAIGGKAAIEGIKDLTVSATVSQMGQEFNAGQVIMAPDKMKQTVMMQGQVLQKMVINGAKSYMEAMGQKQNLPPDAVKEYASEANLQEVLHPEKSGISYKLLGMESVDGKDAYKVEKVEGQKKTVQYYDVANGLLTKEISSSEEGGQAKVEIKTLSGYKEVENGKGYKIPFVEETVGGLKVMVQSAKANSGVKESDFQ